MVSRLSVIVIDAVTPEVVAEFWCAVLGWQVVDRDDEVISIGPADGSGPGIDVVQVPESKQVKNRLHLDVRADGTSTAEELARLQALGARRVEVGQPADVSWVVLADPEGNEFCLLSRPHQQVASPAAADAAQQAAGHPEPPAIGDEASTLLGSLERQRATFEWKSAGLDSAALARRLPSSELSLGRLLKHLAYMEDLNFTCALAGADLPPPWADVGAATRAEWAFVSGDHDSPDSLRGLWREAVHRSRAALREAIEPGGPGTTYQLDDGQGVTLRRLLVDMIEEYARHTGHADLLREAVDGRVGEDPPGTPWPYRLD